MPDTPNSAIPSLNGPRRRIYRIPEAVLLDMLRTLLAGKVPEDIELKGFWRDLSVERNYFHEEDIVLCVSLEHPSFEEVSWRVPIIDVVEKKPVLAQVSVARKVKVG